MTPLAVLSTGMVTGVGWSTEASCAAIRVGITGSVETRFMYDGEFIQGGSVPFETPYRGRRKLIEMAAPAIEEALAPLIAERYAVERVPLLLCLSEPDRPGRFAELDQTLLRDIAERIERRFHPQSAVIAEGRIGGVKALMHARQIMDRDSQIQRLLVCGVDTLLVTASLNHYYEQRRLLTADNSDGFIPGEAAAAVLLGPAVDSSAPQMQCLGLGYGAEPATVDSEEPLRADGIVQAINAALAESGQTLADLDYRITDLSGEQYGFKEATLGLDRLLRDRTELFDIWHPADCIGEVGAAIVPCVLAVSLAAVQKGYAPGPGVLCHFAADGSERAAMVLRYESGRAA
ncbi:MAG: hypothetical protein V3T84_06310 [Phycisphaerales bacterium]